MDESENEFRNFHKDLPLTEEILARTSPNLADLVIIRAVVRGPNPPSTEQVAAMEAKLPAHPKGYPLELRIRFIQTMIIGRDGQLLKDATFRVIE
jgi:hypothetical protein